MAEELNYDVPPLIYVKRVAIGVASLAPATTAALIKSLLEAES
jgi:hypothetical protein